jgi:hypothetical protein
MTIVKDPESESVLPLSKPDLKPPAILFPPDFLQLKRSQVLELASSPQLISFGTY